ncbi:gap junction delta-2 protein-like [Hyla sarda]|uniref:gap junction delta-2 protein-like n=1 Tax=Hyla sarda TaxID=327740 RepID=UPI0024C4148F|nr:gap junction delta-2 protein-like [Hyla sarda]
MGDWSILGRLLTEVQNHSTVIGKIWLTMLLIFRILLVTLVGDAMYGDEQAKFTCNTLQPGCNNVCYDSFAPISHLRFWIFQIVLVSTPSIFYIIYVLHKIAKDEKTELERAYIMELLQSLSIGDNILACSEADKHVEVKDISRKGDRFKPKIPHDPSQGPIPVFDKMHIIYIVHVVLRSIMELVFLVGQYYLYGFEVPHLFQCHTYPCPTKTDCFVSRATEKTVFLNFMFGVGLGCFLLNIAELHYLGWFYVFRILAVACNTCCEFKSKKKRPRVLHAEQNNLLIHLKDTIQERFVLKTSSTLSPEKIGFLPSPPTSTISFTNEDHDDTTSRQSPDIKHSSKAKMTKIKKSWL